MDRLRHEQLNIRLPDTTDEDINRAKRELLLAMSRDTSLTPKECELLFLEELARDKPDRRNRGLLYAMLFSIGIWLVIIGGIMWGCR